MKYDISKVSPRPWSVETPEVIGDGKPSIMDASRDYYVGSAEVIDVDGEANAAHIVHCVNHHEALVEALARLAVTVDGCWGMSEYELRHELGNTNYQCVADKIAKARALLEKAKS